jgi:uracil-DNA glycosylase family 4
MARPSLTAKRGALARLHNEVRACRHCPLWAGRTQVVSGIGPAGARIMFVGEAPGRQEDLKGEPFVGAAGRFFDSLLASAGLDRSDVYITNVVKSRPFTGPPPGRNRPPRPDEIQACRPWLEEELRIVQPEIIVPMGGVAVDAFLPGKKVTEVHGVAHRRNGLIIFPVFHPAMGRWGEAGRRKLTDDFRALRDLIRTQFRTRSRRRRRSPKSEKGCPR